MVSAIEDAQWRRQRAADMFMRNIANRPIARIRIGRVRVPGGHRSADGVCFHLVVENGKVILGRWGLMLTKQGDEWFERLS
jgi:hypothetical protein